MQRVRMQTVAWAFAVVLVIGSLADMGTGQLWEDVPDGKLTSVTGGEYCYLDGTANCPAPSPTCADGQCAEDEQGTWVCDKNGETIAVEEYAIAQEVNPPEGYKEKGYYAGGVNCNNVVLCSCSEQSEEGVCEDGVVVGQTDNRPTSYARGDDCNPL